MHSLWYSLVLFAYQVAFFGSLTVAWRAEEVTMMREVVLVISLVTVLGHAIAATLFSVLSITGPFHRIKRPVYWYFVGAGVALTALIAWACWEFTRDTKQAVMITSLVAAYWSSTAAITLQGVSGLRLTRKH